MKQTLRQTATPRTAFTLMEVVVVMVILVVLGAIAIPLLDGLQDRFKLDASVDQVKARWAECRAHAIEEGRAYRFSIKPDSNIFRIAPDDAEYWDGGGGGMGNENLLIVEEPVEADIQFRLGENGSGADNSGFATVVVFMPDGTCREDAEMKFESPGLKPITLRVRALTGIVTTERQSTPEGGN